MSRVKLKSGALEESASSVLSRLVLEPMPSAKLECFAQGFKSVLELRANASSEPIVGFDDDDPAESESVSWFEGLIHQNDTRSEWVASEFQTLEGGEECLAPAWRSRDEPIDLREDLYEDVVVFTWDVVLRGIGEERLSALNSALPFYALAEG